MVALHEEVRAQYHIAVSPRFVDRICTTVENPTVEFIYQMALKENLKDITDVGTLPYGAASLPSSTLTAPLVLQVNSSRDATQPLKPCLDIGDDESDRTATFHRNSKTRLLRLVLTDGHAEIPAIELSTLGVFRSVPVPGEKLLVREGTEIKNGSIIMTEDLIVPLGGEVQQLKKEIIIRQNFTDAPRFQPLLCGAAGASRNSGTGSHSTSMMPTERQCKGKAGRGYGRGWDHRGGRGGFASRGREPRGHSR
uniref:RecQ-mediated genome instability protein 1 n=1 Tax=Trypanosoma congolense (strain IL3000) TaxID=1068625 RepID=G0URH6_TRYCI|nr:conserved hypothetical protein [Trypanosoma congolense IL3000]